MIPPELLTVGVDTLVGMLVAIAGGILPLAGRRGWKTNGGSRAGVGVSVRLCVGRMAIVLVGPFLGDTCQFSSDQGAICFPMYCRGSNGC